jgi:hypothetical protein
VAEEGRGENKVVQPVNPAANVAANAPVNPAANAPANAPANAAGNVVNIAANIANVQGNVAANPMLNAGTQPPPVQANRAEGSQRQRIRDEVEIARRANYDREHEVPDALDANNPIQADLRHMHDQELLRHAHYDQDNGPPDDLYVIPTVYAPSVSPGAVNNFPAFSRRLRTIRYPKDFKPTIEKYDSRSDPSIWLKMYNIVARASRGNEDHMEGYFPLVMGKAPLLWLDNLPVECITSWATLSRLFMTNYQATYNRPGNTHHLARVQMRRDETLREYTNRYFENRNTLAGVKDEDVIAYYKKGISNFKLFEKIHEADAHTITDLMAYVDKIIDTQDAVMHDFNEEDHDDGGNRSCKRSGEAYMADPPRPSTFLEGDFNMVMDDQCQFHRDAKHTMRECEQLKRALGVPSESKKTKSSNNDDRNGDQRFDNRNCRPDRHDYYDHRSYRRSDNRDRHDFRRGYRRDDRRDDYHHNDRNDRSDNRKGDRRDDQHNDCRDDRRDDRRCQDEHNRHNNNRKERSPPPPPKGGIPNGAFQSANREINFIVGGRQATKSNRHLRSNAREIRHVNTETPQPLRWSEFPITFSRKDHWVHIPYLGTYPLFINPIVDRAFLPKTLINGGSSLNIIFTETLCKMDFDFNKMTTYDEPFYGVVPGKVAYPIGRV